MNTLLQDLKLHLATYYTQMIAILPKLILAILVFTLLYFFAKRTQRFVNARLTKTMDDPLLATFLSRVVKIVIILFASLLALQIVGLASMVTGIITGASISAIVLGFAFKDIGENFLAGIMLAFNRPFRVGDTVELDGYTGTVVALNLRNSRIKTFDGKDIFIPNADVVKNPVVNYTLDGFLRYDFTVGLDSAVDIKQAIQIILQTMQQIDGVLQKEKSISVGVNNLSGNTIELTVYYWLNTFDKTISSGVVKNQAIQEVLQALETKGFYLPGSVVELKNYKGSSLDAI